MEELIKRLERVIATGAPDKDGMHPVSAETVLEVVNELSEHGTNLAEVGTDCISREQAIEALDKRFDSIPMEQTSEILMLRKDLRELPPAQPEHIIHCKDCENHIYRDWCRMVQHTTSNYSDCARELNAKRKENDDE